MVSNMKIVKAIELGSLSSRSTPMDLGVDKRFTARSLAALGMTVVILVVHGLAGITLAKNVDLSTVPKRNTVALTIYNSEDLTLVRETRSITFKKGVNPLQFSWANTLIDPTSVEIKFLTHADKLD